MHAIIEFLAFLVNTAFTFIWWVIIIGVVMSWLAAFNIINMYNPMVRQIYQFVTRVTEPLCTPIRRVMPDMGGIDFSPMIVLILMQGIQIYLLPAFFGSLLRIFG